MWESKYDVVIDLEILNQYDTLVGVGEDYYDEYDYVEFFNDCIKKYNIDIDKVYDVCEIYGIDINYNIVNYYVVQNELERILTEV